MTDYLDLDFKQLSAELFQKLSRARKKTDREVPRFNIYDHYSSKPKKVNSTNDLIDCISIVYSWMPTMLDIYSNEEELEAVVKDLKGLSKIKNSNRFEEKHETIKGVITRLCICTNNSVVGASKLLHLLFPADIPIFDSRTMESWNSIFKGKMKLARLTNKNQVNLFLKYWHSILVWRETLLELDMIVENKVRVVEKPLFDHGGYLLEEKNKENKKAKNVQRETLKRLKQKN